MLRSFYRQTDKTIELYNWSLLNQLRGIITKDVIHLQRISFPTDVETDTWNYRLALLLQKLTILPYKELVWVEWGINANKWWAGALPTAGPTWTPPPGELARLWEPPLPGWLGLGELPNLLAGHPYLDLFRWRSMSHRRENAWNKNERLVKTNRFIYGRTINESYPNRN